MSGKGNCYEFKQVRASGLNDPVDHSKPQNTAVEAFFKTLKAELVWRIKLETREQAERIINDDILNFYNRKRRHSTLGNISPVEYEKQAA
ncbi:MAG: IS3 family transposase [Alphaproteobacteria bacterium]